YMKAIDKNRFKVFLPDEEQDLANSAGGGEAPQSPSAPAPRPPMRPQAPPARPQIRPPTRPPGSPPQPPPGA
ncbi:MAG TPA: hypothetical protein VG733_12590, partial [Chthoniobacteraceae bacterium]|nr:hypothetical protein [Chthoniobacteraceae bacterium]